jgi:hypothetical protein
LSPSSFINSLLSFSFLLLPPSSRTQRQTQTHTYTQSLTSIFVLFFALSYSLTSQPRWHFIGARALARRLIESLFHISLIKIPVTHDIFFLSLSPVPCVTPFFSLYMI